MLKPGESIIVHRAANGFIVEALNSNADLNEYERLLVFVTCHNDWSDTDVLNFIKRHFAPPEPPTEAV